MNKNVAHVIRARRLIDAHMLRTFRIQQLPPFEKFADSPLHNALARVIKNAHYRKKTNILIQYSAFLYHKGVF